MELDFGAMTGFIAAHSAWAMPLIFLVSFGESFAFVSLLIPGTTILAACGALVPGGTLPLLPLLAGAILGAVLGDGISYWLGRRYGSAIVRSWPLSRHPETVRKGEAFLRRHGTAGIAIGRFIGPCRALVPLLAGIAKMNRRAFWLANVGSALVWAPAIMLPGAAMGWIADRSGVPGWWLLGIIAGVAALAGGLIAFRRRGLLRSAGPG